MRSPVSYKPVMNNFPLLESTRPVDELEKRVPLFWNKVCTSWLGILAILLEAEIGAFRSSLIVNGAASTSTVLGEIETTQLGAFFARPFETCVRLGKCGCPPTISSPSSVKAMLSGEKGVETLCLCFRAVESGERV